MKVSILFMLLILGGCTMVAPSTKDAQREVINSIRYVKDLKTGLCFATVESNNGNFGGIVSIATVPCERVGL